MYKKSKTHMIEFEEKNNDAERIIVDLKNQFLVSRMSRPHTSDQRRGRDY